MRAAGAASCRCCRCRCCRHTKLRVLLRWRRLRQPPLPAVMRRRLLVLPPYAQVLPPVLPCRCSSEPPWPMVLLLILSLRPPHAAASWGCSWRVGQQQLLLAPSPRAPLLLPGCFNCLYTTFSSPTTPADCCHRPAGPATRACARMRLLQPPAASHRASQLRPHLTLTGACPVPVSIMAARAASAGECPGRAAPTTQAFRRRGGVRRCTLLAESSF